MPFLKFKSILLVCSQLQQDQEIKNLAKGYQIDIKAKVKFVVVKDADMLTIEAQNALLKLLEEPPSHAVIILATQRKQKLLPTVRSRTVEIITSFQKKRLSKNIEFPDSDFDEAITALSQVENPKGWIDCQIENFYERLLTEVNKNNPDEIKAISKRIEGLSYSKKLIEANVNAKFVLFNLALPASF